MNDEEYRDYRDLSPNSDKEGFQNSTVFLIEAIRQMSAPTEIQKGKATAINEEFQRLDKVLRKMTPEAKEILKYREMEYIKHRWMKEFFHKKTLIEKDILDRYAARVHEGIDSSIGRLTNFIQDPYRGRKEDARQKLLMRMAKEIWLGRGGKITKSEQKSGFYDYIERLVEDSGLNITARTLLQNYA